MKNFKVAISLLCAVACIIAAGFVPSTVNVAAITYPKTLTEIYPSDFGIIDNIYVGTISGQYKGDNKTIVDDGEGTPTLIGTMYTMDFQLTGAPVWIFYGAHSTAQQAAIRFQFDADDRATVSLSYSNENKQTVNCGGTAFTSEKAGVKIKGERYNLSFSTEAIDYDNDGLEDDIKFGVYFNHILYDNQFLYATDMAPFMGNYINFINDPNCYALGYSYQRPYNMEISSPIKAVDETTTVITPADFGMQNGVVNATAELNMDLDKKQFKAENFFKNANESINYAGIKLSQDATGAITVLDSTGNESFESCTNTLEETFIPRDVEIITNLVDNDVDTIKDDLKADIYLDDKLFRTVYVNDYKQNTTNTLTVIGDVESEPEKFSYLSSVVGMDTLGNDGIGVKFDGEKVFSGNLKLNSASAKLSMGEFSNYITLSNFGIAEGSYNKNTTAYGMVDDLDSAYFSAKVTMPLNTSIYFGSTGGASGIEVKNQMNKLRIKIDSTEYLSLSPANAGVTAFTSEFTIGLCAYITDTDSDGNKDDIRLGIWFNEVFNRYLDIADKASSFGNGLYLASTSTNAIIANNMLAEFGEADAAFTPTLKIENELVSIEFANNSGKLAVSGIINKVFNDISADSKILVNVAARPLALGDDAALNDAKVSLYLNGNLAASAFVRDCLTNSDVLVVKLQNTGATVIESLPEDSIFSDRLYDLNQGDFLLYGAHEIFVNRKGGYEAGDLLTVPGEYTIIKMHMGKEYPQKAYLYKAGYINDDDDINILDFIVTKRVMAGLSDKLYQRKGSDINFDGNIDSTDLLSVKRMVLGLETPPEKSPADKFTFRENIMPIAGYYGPLLSFDLSIEDGGNEGERSFNNLTENVYRLIAEAGINYINKIETRKEIQQENWKKTGEYADKYGIDVAYSVALNDKFNDAEWAQALSKYAHFRSFQSAFVRDEPWAGVSVGFPSNSTTDHMATYSAFSTRTNKFANLMGYTNLLPYYNSLTGDEDNDALYQAYLDKYIADFAPKMISYDYYPFPSFGEDDYKRYYRNLRIVRDTAMANDMPFWTYIQVGAAEKGLYVGTEAEMRWNVNTNLAYGAKGIQYYTLIQTYGASTWYMNEGEYNFNNAGVIAANGQPTQYYPYVQRINQQIAAVDEVLVNADFKKVLAVGYMAQEQTEESTTNYGAITKVEASDMVNGLVIGCFTYKGKQAFYIVNNNKSGNNTATITLDGTYNINAIASGVNETVIANTYSVTLAAGDARLIVLN